MVWKHMKSAYILFSSQSLDPSKRIGCEEMGGYDPLKQHPFFDTISWSDLHIQTPPKLTPYLPAMSEDDEDCYGNVKCFFSILEQSRLLCISAYLWEEVTVISWWKLWSQVNIEQTTNVKSSITQINSILFCFFHLSLFQPQYDDLLSQFSNMQVAQSSSSHSLSPHESTPPQRSSSNIEQYIHDLDNNSFELDLQFTEEEKQLLLDKQTTGNPW